MTKQAFTIQLAPLQGLTNHIFRNAFQKHFSGIDVYYAPWVRADRKSIIPAKYQRDLAPENNQGIRLIPQIMTNKAEDFLHMDEYIASLGYSEINWNLGCPYPMVAKRGMGSGMLAKAETIIALLEEVMPKLKTSISLKVRLGYTNPEELLQLLPQLDSFPLSSIIIHARTGIQMYKGNANPDAFEACLSQSSHKLVYNGDIINNDSFSQLQQRFPSIDTWMLGRGLLSQPFLAEMLKKDESHLPDQSLQRFREFHNDLMYNYGAYLSGDKHLLQRMTAYWEYFSNLCINPHKAYKRIKKANSINAYGIAVQENLNEWKNETDE